MLPEDRVVAVLDGPPQPSRTAPPPLDLRLVSLRALRSLPAGQLSECVAKVLHETAASEAPASLFSSAI